MNLYDPRAMRDDRRPEAVRLSDPRVRIGQDFTAGEEYQQNGDDAT